MQKEAMLQSQFVKWLVKKWGADVYKVVGSSYTKVGQPDLIVCLPGYVRVFFVELKRDTTLDESIKHLRPEQIARSRELTKVGQLVVLQYDGGCAYMNAQYEWHNLPDDGQPFRGFETLIHELGE